MASSLNGKVAIVTGSSAGIGEAIALSLASWGVKVTFTGRDKDRLQAVVKKAVDVSGGHQDRFLAVTGDINDTTVREELIEQTVKIFGRLDILVANAGVAYLPASFLEHTDEIYDKMMDTNVKSVFFLIQKAVPHLEKTKGNIINISSIASTVVISGATAYSVSKAALDHLTRCLAVDLGSKGIRVNSVNPGYFRTQIFRHLEDEVEKFNEMLSKSEAAKQSLKGRTGILEDVAEAVEFLASDAAGFVTGEFIKVDGGRSYN